MMERGRDAEREGPWKRRYRVTGSVATTPDTLHLEVLVNGQLQEGKCVANATGIFTSSGKEAVEVEEGRLGTNDIEELCARGTLFFFTLDPTCFHVAFYDAARPERKLGELRSLPLPVAGNPGFGVARWSPRSIQHAPAHTTRRIGELLEEEPCDAGSQSISSFDED